MKAPRYFLFLGNPSMNKVIKAWHLIVICLLAVYCAVDDCFDHIFLITSCPNSSSFSGSSRALLSTCLFLVVSYSSSDTWNTSCIFYFAGSSSLYACFSTVWRTRKGPKNLLLSFLFLFVYMYLLFSQTFLPKA